MKERMKEPIDVRHNLRMISNKLRCLENLINDFGLYIILYTFLVQSISCPGLSRRPFLEIIVWQMPIVEIHWGTMESAQYKIS